VNHSYFLCGSVWHRIAVDENKPLSQADVEWGSGRPDGMRAPRTALHIALQNLGVPSLEDRHALLSYGSNASPEGLARKFSDMDATSSVPMIKARARGIDVVYSAHLTSYAAVAATLAPAEGTEVDVFVGFFDDVQLKELTKTEPNYEAVTLLLPDEVRLETGERLIEVQTFISRHGMLLIDDNPRRLSAIPVISPKYEGWDEPKVLEKLCEWWKSEDREPPVDDVDDFITKMLEHPKIVTQWLSTRRLHTDFPIKSGPAPKWRELSERSLQVKTEPNFPVMVFRTPGDQPRPRGDYVVGVRPSKLGEFRDFVVVEGPNKVEPDKPLRLIARTTGVSAAEDTHAYLDQTVRDAVGVAVSGRVRLSALRDKRGRFERFIDLLVPRRYVVLRVHTADSLFFEKGACAVPPVTLEMLGIAPGDEVVVESAVEHDGVLRRKSIVLRAFSLSEEARRRREEIKGASPVDRFPDCGGILGVQPDLPWILLDRHDRMGLDLTLCSPVRIRASRKSQFIKQFREYALLILVALLGALLVLDSGSRIRLAWWRVGAGVLVFSAALLLVISLIFVGIRKRLG
jgi:hypothetical protein